MGCDADAYAVSGFKAEERAFVDFVVQPDAEGCLEKAEISNGLELHFHATVLVIHLLIGLV